MAAEFHYLAHAIGTSFEANLAYSIVIHLGNLAGSPITDWIEKETVRVVSALCETTSFKEDTFRRELKEVQDKYKKYIATLNRWCVRWAFVAAVVDVVLLVSLPFAVHAEVDAWVVIVMSLFLFGSVATGLFGVYLLQRKAKHEMRSKSKQYDSMIAMFEKAPNEKVEEATAALLARMDAERAQPIPPANLHH